MTKLLGISGALRAQSTNTALVRTAAEIFAPTSFTQANLRLPLYDGDLETTEGIPDDVQALSDQIADADAVIISSPEYNKALSGVLKNALDWVSRTKGHPWAGKPVAIMSATAGRSGGERAQSSLILCLAPFRPLLIMGPEVLVGSNYEAFDDQGTLSNEANLKAIAELMDKLKAAI